MKLVYNSTRQGICLPCGIQSTVNTPALILVTKQMNAVHTLIHYFRNVYFHMIFPSTLWFSKQSLPLSLSDGKLASPFNSLWRRHRNNIWRKKQIINFFIVLFSAAQKGAIATLSCNNWRKSWQISVKPAGVLCEVSVEISLEHDALPPGENNPGEREHVLQNVIFFQWHRCELYCPNILLLPLSTFKRSVSEQGHEQLTAHQFAWKDPTKCLFQFR
jgi:hypothetical protein